MPYKVEKFTLKTTAFEMEYATFGNGNKPFVIIPGISVKSVLISASAIADAYNAFGKEYKVYVFDRKKNIDVGYDVLSMTDDLAEAMKMIGIRDAYMFGASQGGMILLVLAARYPELVAKAVIGSSAAKSDAEADSILGHWAELARRGDRKTLNREFVAAMYSDKMLRQMGDVLSVMDDMGTPDELKRFSVLADACVGFDFCDSLDMIKCPTLVIGSEGDKVFSKNSSLEIAEKLNCKVYIYDGYGHAVYDEAPDYINRLLEFFSVE